MNTPLTTVPPQYALAFSSNIMLVNVIMLFIIMLVIMLLRKELFSGIKYTIRNLPRAIKQLYINILAKTLYQGKRSIISKGLHREL